MTSASKIASQRKKHRQNQLPKAHKTLDYSLNTKDIYITERPGTEILKALKLRYFLYLHSLYHMFLPICKKQLSVTYLEMSQFYQGHLEI